MLCSLATKMDQKQLDEIGGLEKELGVPVLAFACHAAEPAEISGDQVAKLKELEGKLGVSLVAVKG
jgi:hypothetical protein